jgi:hypothetical protein
MHNGLSACYAAQQGDGNFIRDFPIPRFSTSRFDFWGKVNWQQKAALCKIDIVGHTVLTRLARQREKVRAFCLSRSATDQNDETGKKTSWKQ